MAGITEVGKKLAEEYNVTLASAKVLAVAVLDTVYDMAKVERVRIGKHIFKPTVRKARMGINPKTKEPLQIPEKHGIKYKHTGDKAKEAKVAPAPKTKAKAEPKPKASKKTKK